MRPFISFIRSRAGLILLLTLIVHSLYSSLFVIFHQDNARDVALSAQYIEQGQYIVGYGPKVSVWNFKLSPFYYQLHTIVSLMTGNQPLAMKWLTTILESFTPVLLYVLLKEVVTKNKATVLALLYAVSPFLIAFATTSWNPDMIPFFSTLSLVGWLYYLRKNKSWGVVIAIVSVTITIHLHYQSVVLLLFPGFVFLWKLLRKELDIRPWLVGSLIALVITAPYFAAEIKNNWENTRQIVTYFTSEHTRYYDSVSKPAYILSFIPSFLERIIIEENARWRLGQVLFFTSMPIFGWYAVTKRKVHFWFFLYFMTVVIMLRVYKGIKLDYYMSTLFIFPFFLLAYLWRYSKYTIFIVALFFGLAVSNLLGKQPRNDLRDLEVKIDYLKQAVGDQNVRIFFHNDDEINTYAYLLLQNPDIHIVTEGTAVLEVCDGQERRGCQWHGYATCLEDRTHTYMSLLKASGSHVEVMTPGVDARFVLTTYQQEPVIPKYRPYEFEYDASHGNDTLLPAAFTW